MTAFEFATANRIIFGVGKFAQAGEIAASFGKRVLLVTGGASCDEPANRLMRDLAGRGLETVRFVVSGEPSITTIENGLSVAREHGAEVVIGLGGGSPMDSAKCIGGLLTNQGGLLDYLEVVGKGQPLTEPAAPVIAIPTTAGTGAEVTRNSVLSVPDKQVKASVRSPYLLPRVALVDPELTYSLPPEITASTGLDALTQLIEAFLSRRATLFTEMIAAEGLKHVFALTIAYDESAAPKSQARMNSAREHMAIASLFGGLALANGGLGAVHGFAAVLGARYPIPHGVCCGILLPHVIDANVKRISYDPLNPVEISLLEALQTDENIVDWLYRLIDELKMPTLSHYGVTTDAAPELVRLSKMSSSMKANPVELTDDELSAILLAAL